MVGRDRVGELICDGELSWGDDCCCAAASKADVAVWGSGFDFGDVEKKEVILFALEVDGRRGMSFFSDRTSCVVGVVGVVGAETAKGLRGLRGIAKREPSVFMECNAVEIDRIDAIMWYEL